MRGMSYVDIAQQLGAKPKTVNTHRESLMRKLDCENNIELTAAGILLGVLTLVALPLKQPRLV
jgi:DNA-binding CsgD family transcriptional regulator